MACPECWEEDHPQNHVGELRVVDNQALRNPRPDSPTFGQSRALIIPVRRLTTTGFVGQVTV
jgi:hypothetical protein